MPTQPWPEIDGYRINPDAIAYIYWRSSRVCVVLCGGNAAGLTFPADTAPIFRAAGVPVPRGPHEAEVTHTATTAKSYTVTGGVPEPDCEGSWLGRDPLL